MKFKITAKARLLLITKIEFIDLREINGLPLYIINAKHCISSTQSVVSYQAAGVCTFGDVIRKAMIYTLKCDDIPSLRLG